MPVQSSPVRDSVPESPHNKVLLVTLIAPVGNYGNILQHYALQEAIKSLGYDVESLDCPMIELGFAQKMLDAISGFAVKNLKRTVKLVLAALGVKKYREKLIAKLKGKQPSYQPTASQQSRRNTIFQDFYREYIDTMIPSTYREVLTSSKSRWSKYKYVIAGSDQILNIGIVRTFEALRYYYLEFAAEEQRVSYAPSFGVSRLKFHERHVHRKGLQGFKKLSCREEEGCRIIKELTGREAELVLDPTLLITADDWRKIARKPSYPIPEHYALCYFWNNNNEEYMRAVRELSGGRQVIYALDYEHDSYSMTGPREFVWLIDHADYVFTESFHGTAFSVNFRKKFVAFGTAPCFDRIRTLLANTGLLDRIYYPDKEFIDSEIDYDAVNKRLSFLREDSMKYLVSCLA